MLFRSELVHEPNVGDGVHAAIISSRQGLVKQADVFNKTVGMSVDRLQVEKGETVDFLVDIGKGLNSDMFYVSGGISINID